MKLRLKFVGIAFFSIMLITAIILGITVLENFMIVDEQINQVIDIIEANNNLVVNGDYLSEPSIYATRYFIVTFTEGEIDTIDMSKIATINEKTARNIALNAYITNEEFGYNSSFKFKRVEDNDIIKYIFLDVTLQLQNLKSMSEATIAIYMISMVVLIGFLMSISGIVLKPISDNMKYQKQFVTNAGHELKTPLAIIAADVDVLELEVGEDNEWVQSIRNQTERLNQLIKSLLSLSRHDALNKEEHESIVFNLSDLIKEEIDNFKPMASNKTLSFHQFNNSDIYVKSEIDNIRQLLGLFLDNAIKYTPDGKEIQVSLKKYNKKITLIFENHYDNSKKLNTKRLFERFYRGEKSHDNAIQGYGIGLSIVQSIVERYNGNIEVGNENDKIRFIVTLKHNKRKHFEIL